MLKGKDFSMSMYSFICMFLGMPWSTTFRAAALPSKHDRKCRNGGCSVSWESHAQPSQPSEYLQRIENRQFRVLAEHWKLRFLTFQRCSEGRGACAQLDHATGHQTTNSKVRKEKQHKQKQRRGLKVSTQAKSAAK